MIGNSSLCIDCSESRRKKAQTRLNFFAVYPPGSPAGDAKCAGPNLSPSREAPCQVPPARAQISIHLSHPPRMEPRAAPRAAVWTALRAPPRSAQAHAPGQVSQNCPFGQLSVRLSICPSVSVGPSPCLSVMCVCVSVHLCCSAQSHMPVCPFVRLSFHFSVCSCLAFRRSMPPCLVSATLSASSFCSFARLPVSISPISMLLIFRLKDLRTYLTFPSVRFRVWIRASLGLELGLREGWIGPCRHYLSAGRSGACSNWFRRPLFTVTLAEGPHPAYGQPAQAYARKGPQDQLARGMNQMTVHAPRPVYPEPPSYGAAAAAAPAYHERMPYAPPAQSERGYYHGYYGQTPPVTIPAAGPPAQSYTNGVSAGKRSGRTDGSTTERTDGWTIE